VDRCAILVDAGYLYAAGGKICHNVTTRKAVQMDVLKAHEFLTDLAIENSGGPILLPRK